MYKVCHVIWFRLHFWRYVVLLFTPCWQYYKFNGLLLFCLIIGQKKKQSWNFISFELNERITSRPFYVLTLLFPQFVRVCISRRYKRMVNLSSNTKNCSCCRHYVPHRTKTNSSHGCYKSLPDRKLSHHCGGYKTSAKIFLWRQSWISGGLMESVKIFQR